MFGRYKNANYIQQLDPQKDHEEIVFLVGAYENPWLIKKSLEFALFRTYAVPYISRVLQGTGQFSQHGQKRYDDTSLMLAGIAEHGYDSDFAKIVISKMNELHGRYNLSNESMLYVLSTFALEPSRWSERYGWRKPMPVEQEANAIFWHEIGKRMGLQDIPRTFAAFDAYNRAYEQEHFTYDDANRYIGDKTVAIFLGWYPAPLRPLVRQGLYALMDKPLRDAMGYPKANWLIQQVVHQGLRLRGFMMRFMLPRRKPFLFTRIPTRTYPEGFTPDELGAR